MFLLTLLFERLFCFCFIVVLCRHGFVTGGGGRGGERRDREKYSLDSPRVQHVSGHVPLVRLDVHLEDIDKALQTYQHGLYVA